MGAFLDRPKTEKHNEHGEGNGLRYGVASMQGWRCEMEDAHFAKTNLGLSLEDWNYFAVFDGHAGVKVSEHCASNLLDNIIQTDEFKQKNIVKGIHTGFLKLDKTMRQLPEIASGSEKSGTTAVCAFISETHIYIANCGDSRAVLCRNGVPIFSTQDHKPVLPGEKERIQNAGGQVMIQRVNGSLAVSRALGDYEYKKDGFLGECQQLVSPEPEIFREERNPQDEFLILACDGIWDVMNNEDVCSFVQSRLKVTSDLTDITNQVLDTCLYKQSRDNMSIIIIVFPGGPQPTPEATEAEAALDAYILSRMKEICENMEPVELSEVLKQLSQENIPNLPPGGGLESKCALIAKSFKELYPNMADICDLGNLYNIPKG